MLKFVIGLMIGGLIGVTVMACVIAGKDTTTNTTTEKGGGSDA